MKLPVEYAAAFRKGYVEMSERCKAIDLTKYPEHMHRGSQSEIARQFRVATKLNIARIALGDVRERPAKAMKAARTAGRYFAEYRFHWHHLMGLQ